VYADAISLASTVRLLKPEPTSCSRTSSALTAFWQLRQANKPTVCDDDQPKTFAFSRYKIPVIRWRATPGLAFSTVTSLRCTDRRPGCRLDSEPLMCKGKIFTRTRNHYHGGFSSFLEYGRPAAPMRPHGRARAIRRTPRWLNMFITLARCE